MKENMNEQQIFNHYRMDAEQRAVIKRLCGTDLKQIEAMAHNLANCRHFSSGAKRPVRERI
jgi:hypothetical protein